MSDKMNKNDLTNLLSVKEAAPKIGMAVGTIYNRINNLKNFPIPFLKVGKLIMFDPGDIAEYRESRKVRQLGLDKKRK